MAKKDPKEKAIVEYLDESQYKPSDRVKRLGNLIYWDLHFGPITGCDECGADYTSECTCEIKWPGFVEACKEVREWAEELPTLFYTEDTDEVSLIEPNGGDLSCEDEDHEHLNDCYDEPMPYWEVGRNEIIRYYFGSYVSEYV